MTRDVMGNEPDPVMVDHLQNVRGSITSTVPAGLFGTYSAWRELRTGGTARPPDSVLA